MDSLLNQIQTRKTFQSLLNLFLTIYKSCYFEDKRAVLRRAPHDPKVYYSKSWMLEAWRDCSHKKMVVASGVNILPSDKHQNQNFCRRNFWFSKPFVVFYLALQIGQFFWLLEISFVRRCCALQTCAGHCFYANLSSEVEVSRTIIWCEAIIRGLFALGNYIPLHYCPSSGGVFELYISFLYSTSMIHLLSPE